MSRRCGYSKPIPTPLNGLAMKPGKTRRHVMEGNAGTIIGKPPVKNLPRTASEAGGETKRRYGKANHRRNPPAYRQRGGGGETKKGELKENAGATTRETNVKTLLQAIIVAGRARRKGENQYETGPRPPGLLRPGYRPTAARERYRSKTPYPHCFPR